MTCKATGKTTVVVFSEKKSIYRLLANCGGSLSSSFVRQTCRGYKFTVYLLRFKWDHPLCLVPRSIWKSWATRWRSLIYCHSEDEKRYKSSMLVSWNGILMYLLLTSSLFIVFCVFFSKYWLEVFPPRCKCHTKFISMDFLVSALKWICTTFMGLWPVISI